MTDLTREGLVELATKVEQASGPDRELDHAIQLWCVNEGRLGSFKTPDAWLASAKKYAWGHARYTASLDAAMTLVPEGLWAEGSLSSPGQLEVHGPCTYDPLGKGWAATPALALCAAALKARARAMEAGRG